MWKRYLVTLVIVTAVLFHMVMTALYLGPSNLARDGLGDLVTRYMQPFFIQNWHLFSPNPGVNTYKLWVDCNDDGQWTDTWIALQKKHENDRFAGLAKLLFLHMRSAVATIEKFDDIGSACVKSHPEGCEFEAVWRETRSTAEFARLSRYVRGVCAAQGAAGARPIRGRIMRLFPKDYGARDDGPRWSKVENFDFVIAGEP
ncbi:MAG: DUF5819 family protein [Minicystis sp.]